MEKVSHPGTACIMLQFVSAESVISSGPAQPRALLLLAQFSLATVLETRQWGGEAAGKAALYTRGGQPLQLWPYICLSNELYLSNE